MHVAAWLEGFPPADQTLVFSGAGTSVDGPSCIPPGLGLTKRVLEEAAGLTRDDISDLGSLFHACGMPGGFPRFETVLGVVAEVLGEDGLRDMLRDVIAIRPNDLHAMFAEHIAAGGTHVTANIDCGIERAGGSPASIIHFHGAADGTSDLRSLGITLSNVENGFPTTMENALRTRILTSSIRGIVVVGYSGTDYFDVNPFLESLTPDRELTGKFVLWLDFDFLDATLRVDESHLDPNSTTAETIKTLRRAGADVTVLRGSVRMALEQLARHWALTEGNLANAPGPCDHLASMGAKDEQRAAVRVALFDRLGYLPGLQEEERRGSGIPAYQGVHAMADWNRGRYRAAAAKWQHWFADHPERHLLRAERVVACDWVAGRHVRALLGLQRLLQELESCPGASIATRLVIADTGTRLWDHMLELPDTRWLATQRLQRRLLASLPTSAEAVAAQLSPDLQDRLRVARVKIDPAAHTARDVETLHSRAYERNSQTSSIVRTLNYLQGSIRQTAHTRRDNSSDILRLWETWQRLDAHGEAVRLFTIPGATHVVGLRNALRYLWSSPVDYPVYHRLRMVVLITVLHLRHSHF